MAKLHHRAFALFMALLFLATSVAFSAAIIWQITTQDDTQKTTETTQTNQEETKQTMQDFEPLGDERVTELEKIDKQVGTGKEATAGVTVVVDYTGALTKDGTIFDSSVSRGQPAEFSLNGVIPGFAQGIEGMKVGGERRIIIPAALGYGTQDNGTIPADSDLVFDVKLVEVK